MPSTFAPGGEGGFTLEVSSAAPLRLSAAPRAAVAVMPGADGADTTKAATATADPPDPSAAAPPSVPAATTTRAATTAVTTAASTTTASTTTASTLASGGRWVELGQPGAEAAEADEMDEADEADEAGGLPGRFVEVEDFGHKVFQAAGCGRPVELRGLLAEGRCDVDEADGEGSTALMAASGEGHVACATLLLQAGAVASRSNATGGTALHHACYRGQHAVARLLLAADADADALDGSRCTPLLAAANAGHPSVLRLLLGGGADATRRMEGRDAAQWAALRGHARCAELLIAAAPRLAAARPLMLDRRRVVLAGLQGRAALNGAHGTLAC